MNPIHFIGAGPGDPELITVKGARLLREADLVIYAGSLVNPALIADLDAEVHNSAAMDLPAIVTMMIEAARAGRKVVRLHTGDPAIFGAIREQMAELDAAGVPYEVVPGVTSATATAAALKVELTLPEVSQTVIITRHAGRTPVPEKENLRSLAAHQATLLIFLSVGMIDQVVTELIAGGLPPRTPAAVVEKASWPAERIIRAPLDRLAAEVRAAGIKKTAMIAVGRVFAEGPPAVFSKLYDPEFTHGCRQGGQGGRNGVE